AALLTPAYVRFRRAPERALLVADALGLAVFTISGTQLAWTAGLPGAIAVMMGVITGVAGGMMRDVLTTEIPLILRREHLYATAAIVGGSLFLLLDVAGVPRSVSTLLGVLTVFLVRLGSILWSIHLPAFVLPPDADD